MPALALLALGLATPALAAPDIAPIGLRPDFAAAAVRAPACGAGTPVPEGALTLAELVDLALCRSPVTSGSWASVRSAAARRGQTRALYGPSIDAAVGPDAGFSRRWGGGFPASTDWSTSAAASLSLRWLLFDFGGREARFSAADANLEAAIASFADQAQAVVLETALAYNGLLSSSAAEEAARANLEFARASLEAATAREAAGVAIRSERLQADAALAQAELAYRQTQGQTVTARGRLATAIALPPQTMIAVAPPPPLPSPSELGRSAEELIAAADKLRPDLQLAAASARAALANVRLTEAERRPSVSLGAGPAVNIGTGGQDVASGSVGVTLSIPLFDSGGRTLAVAEARASADAAAAQLEDRRQQAALQVWSGWQAFETEAANLGTARRLLTSALEAAQLAQGRYRAGLASVTELLDAQAQLVSARNQLVGAEFGVRSAELQLARAIGSIGEAIE